ncbi:hypothetical protein ACFPL7_23635 [Dongia soli]|uniref:Uncharacterized protein n=1 Tax=Dongia soli TaxID=600628 RepID=A0ABU5EFW3_9PROT|nr:hypothetical protein [Dongia soli]MDY0885295.1 hypothetical protein [Dongia soli]
MPGLACFCSFSQGQQPRQGALQLNFQAASLCHGSEHDLLDQALDRRDRAVAQLRIRQQFLQALDLRPVSCLPVGRQIELRRFFHGFLQFCFQGDFLRLQGRQARLQGGDGGAFGNRRNQVADLLLDRGKVAVESLAVTALGFAGRRKFSLELGPEL